MNIKQILSIVFNLVCFIESSTAACNPYSFFGEIQDCGVPEERGDELFARPKLYRISNLQLFFIFLLLLFIYYSVRLLIWYEQKKEEELNTERSCTCPITQTSPDITETEILSWEPTSFCEVPESENSKGLITVSLTFGIFQTRGLSKYKEGLKGGVTCETFVWLTQKVVLKDRYSSAARTIFIVGWAAVFRNTPIELESQDHEGVDSAEVETNTAKGEWVEVSNKEGHNGGVNSDGEGNDVKAEENKEDSSSDEEDQWHDIEDCEKCVHGIIMPETRELTEAEENEQLAKELIDGMVRQMLDSSTGGVPATMEEKVYMEDLLETKLALEEEWDYLERTRSNNYEERMRRTDEYLSALRSQVQQLSDFSKEHGNLDSLNSPNGRPSRSAENVSRTNFDPPCTRIHGMPPMIKPLIKSNHVHCPPKRMPSPPARAAGFPRNQEVRQRFPPSYQDQMRTTQSPMIVPGIQAPVTTWCSMQERTSGIDMRQRNQEGSQGTPRGSPQCYPTVSVSIGGTRRRCLCKNTSPRETNILCSVCRKKHLS